MRLVVDKKDELIYGPVLMTKGPDKVRRLENLFRSIQKYS